MEKSTACLISDHSDFREKIDQYLRSNDLVELIKFTNVADFIKWAKGQKINGVILDFKSLIKTNMAEKEFLNVLEKKIVLARSNYNPNTKEIASQVNGEFYQESDFFKYFINQILDPKISQHIRKHERFDRVWNVEIYNVQNQIIEKSITKNASSEGLFIVSSLAYDPSIKYKLKILELENNELLEFAIKWAIPWGKSNNQFPGIGIEFTNLSEKCKSKINDLLGI